MPSPRLQPQRPSSTGDQHPVRLSLTPGRRSILPSIVTGDLVQPSQDPDTGLEIFPRLPEDDEDEEAEEENVKASSGTITRSRSHSSASQESAWSQRGKACASPLSSSLHSSPQGWPRRGSRLNITESIMGLFRASPGPSPCTTPRSPTSPHRRHRSGGHIYCKHTLNETCRCNKIMTLAEGDYCQYCWDGCCPAGEPASTSNSPRLSCSK